MKRILPLLCLIVVLLVLFLNSKVFLRGIYKTSFKEYVETYSKEYGVDELMIYSIIKAESNFNVRAVSNKGACGLMQLMDNTAQEVAMNELIDYEADSTLYNPDKNIKIGTKYFADLKELYSNDEVALAAYNAGIGNVNKWINSGIIKADGSNIENIPFKETNTYVRRILKNYKMYKKLYKE